MHEYNNPADGFLIRTTGTAKQVHSILFREGCDGSANCALEIYGAKGTDFLGTPGINLHCNDEELEEIYRAIKVIRKARLTTLTPPS